MSLYAAAGTDSNAAAVSAAVCAANEDKIYIIIYLAKKEEL